MPNLRLIRWGARPNFDDGSVAAFSTKVTQQIQQFAPAIQWFTSSYRPPTKRFLDLTRHLERSHDTAWMWFQANKLITPMFAADDAQTRTFTAPSRKPLDVRYHLERSRDDAWMYFRSNQLTVPQWPANEFLLDSYLPPLNKKRILDERWLEDLSDAPGTFHGHNLKVKTYWPAIEFLADSFMPPPRRVLDERWLEDVSDTPWQSFPPSLGVSPACDFLTRSYRTAPGRQLDVRWNETLNTTGWFSQLFSFDVAKGIAARDFFIQSYRMRDGQKFDVRSPIEFQQSPGIFQSVTGQVQQFRSSIDQLSQFERVTSLAHILSPGIKRILGRSSGTGPGDFIPPPPFGSQFWPAFAFLSDSYTAPRHPVLDPRWLERARDDAWLASINIQAISQQRPAVDSLIQSFRPSARRVLDARWLETSNETGWSSFPPLQRILNYVPVSDFLATYRVASRAPLTRWHQTEFQQTPQYFTLLPIPFDPKFFPGLDQIGLFGRAIYTAHVLAPGLKTLLGRSSGAGANFVPSFDPAFTAMFYALSGITPHGFRIDPRAIQPPQETGRFSNPAIFNPAFFSSLDQLLQFGRQIRVAHVLAPGRKHFPKSAGSGSGAVLVQFDPQLVVGFLDSILPPRHGIWHPGLTQQSSQFATPYDLSFLSAIEFFRQSAQVLRRPSLYPGLAPSADTAWVFTSLPAAPAFDPTTSTAPFLTFGLVPILVHPWHPGLVSRGTGFATPYLLSFLSAINWLAQSFMLRKPYRLDPGWLETQQPVKLFDVQIPSQFQGMKQFIDSFVMGKPPYLDLRWLETSQQIWIAEPFFGVPLYQGVDWFTKSFLAPSGPLWRPGLLERQQDIPFYSLVYDPAIFVGVKHLVDSFMAMGPGRLDDRWFTQPSQAWIFKVLPFDPSQFQGIKQFLDSYMARGPKRLEVIRMELNQDAWIFKNLPPDVATALAMFIHGKFFGRGGFG